MEIFKSFYSKLQNIQNNSQLDINISGISYDLWPFFLINKRDFHEKNHLIICPTSEIAEEVYININKNVDEFNILYYPGLEDSPYNTIIPSEKNLIHRLRALSNLILSNKKNIVVASIEAFGLRTPPKNFFKNHSFSLEISDIISPDELAQKLIEIGYGHSTTVEEPGTFSKKGEIFDIFPISASPFRIQYFDDMIEEIHTIEESTYKTNRDKPLDKVLLTPAPHIFTNEIFRNQLRSNLPVPGPAYREKFEDRKKIFDALGQGILFDQYPVFIPLFFEKTSSLIDFFKPENTLISIIESNSAEQEMFDLFDLIESDYNSQELSDKTNIPSPDQIYIKKDISSLTDHFKIFINNINYSELDIKNFENSMSLNLEPANIFFSRHITHTQNKFEYIKSCFEFIKDFFEYSGNVIISTRNDNSKNEIKYLIDQNDFPLDLKKRITYRELNISKGIYYENEKVLILTDNDLFAKKQSKTKNKPAKKFNVFAEQLATIKSGDYIIHSEHGIGEYIGLESLDIGTTKTDYIIIQYAGNDKIYVPVYNMHLISKHADSSTSARVANLRNNKFIKAKDNAKKSIKKLAFDLLKLQAERESSPAYSFSETDHNYKEFELAFPFDETTDQTAATEDVIKAMQKPVAMDHLVCGDVGFGKTEVAMRAAYKAVVDSKQVAILVPTTILALQHYNSFKSRFKDFPVNIDYISRFRTTKEVTEIKDNLKDGKVDILIGTHKLLSNTIKYKDLGLVIVDEEQRFGVTHKEKLKLLKSTVDFLTLTATPIPRTLQLSFLGLKSLSLIKTAPPRRQSIKSYVIREDDQTIKLAIEKELQRGGQVFYIHNRVSDIEEVQHKLSTLIPNAKIIFAHGQLQEKDLEDRIQKFYNGEYQILISTTIIESGIDIPNANTLIVNNSHAYGLSQLHQIRGRIGRSDKKAYAYFMIPKHKAIGQIAESRLKALKTYADMGSGFSIASCDLELRGAGDILGANQSGHLESIGLELYMDLLKEAIYEIRGEQKILNKDIDVKTPFPSYIPNNYISDNSERLKQYKIISNCESIDELDNISDELQDIFGVFPAPMVNLFTMITIRVLLQECGVISVHAAGRIATVKFDKNILSQNEVLRNNIVETFISKPHKYQLQNDYSAVYKAEKELDQSSLIKFIEEIKQQIVPS